MSRNNRNESPFNGYHIFSTTVNRGAEYLLYSCSFRNGVPNGKWEAYGYGHEILMNGVYTPILEIEEIQKEFPYLKRINIDRYTEGTDEQMIDLLLISSNPAIDSVNYELKKTRLFEYLVKEKYLFKDEIQHEVFCYAG